MSKERRAIRFIDRTIDKVLTIIFLIILMIGIYFVYDSWYVFNAAALDRVPGYTPETPEEMLEVSKNAIAWITIDDTKISYPIVQGETNTEYLNKNADGEYSLSGAIFLDSLNDPLFTDYYSVLYGHHMAGGYMFGAIDYYDNEKYFDEHRNGTLLVVDGKKYDVDIYALVKTDASVSVVFDVTSGGDVAGYVAANASIYREHAEGRILALSTCKSPLTTERTVLFATIKEKGDAGSRSKVQDALNEENQKQNQKEQNP